MNIELKNQLNEIPRTILDAMLEGLLAIRAWRENPDDGESLTGRAFGDANGICSSLVVCLEWEVVSDKDFTRAKKVLFQAWPEFSGCSTYPVPGNEEDREYLDEHYDEELEEWVEEDQRREDEELAEYAFDNTEDMWAGEYGARRLRLLNFMIDTIVAYGVEEGA